MTAHRWRGRVHSVLVVVLFGQAGKARADHLLTHPAISDRRTTTAQKAIVAMPPAVRTTRRNAPELFKNRTEITIQGDAEVCITPRNIPEHDRFLKAYSIETADKAGSVVPGLLSITDQAYRARSGPRRRAPIRWLTPCAMRSGARTRRASSRRCCPRAAACANGAKAGTPLHRLASGPLARASHLTLVDCVQEGSDVWKN